MYSVMPQHHSGKAKHVTCSHIAMLSYKHHHEIQCYRRAYFSGSAWERDRGLQATGWAILGRFLSRLLKCAVLRDLDESVCGDEDLGADGMELERGSSVRWNLES